MVRRDPRGARVLRRLNDASATQPVSVLGQDMHHARDGQGFYAARNSARQRAPFGERQILSDRKREEFAGADAEGDAVARVSA